MIRFCDRAVSLAFDSCLRTFNKFRRIKLRSPNCFAVNGPVRCGKGFSWIEITVPTARNVKSPKVPSTMMMKLTIVAEKKPSPDSLSRRLVLTFSRFHGLFRRRHTGIVKGVVACAHIYEHLSAKCKHNAQSNLQLWPQSTEKKCQTSLTIR